MVSDPINPWLDADELKQLAESLMQGGPKPRRPMPQDAGFGDGFVGFAGSEKPTSNSLPATATTSSTVAQSVATPKPTSVSASQSASATAAPLPSAALASQRSTATPPTKQASVSNGTPIDPISPPPPAKVVSTPPAPQLIPPHQPAGPVASLTPTQAEATTTPQATKTYPNPSSALAPSVPAEKSVRLVIPAAPSNEPEQQCLQFQSDMQHQFGSGPIFILNRNGHTVFGKENYPQFQFIAQSLTKHSKRRGLPKGHIHIKVGPAQILEIIPVDLPNGGWVVGTLVSKPLQPEEIAHWVRELTKLSSTLIQL